MSRLVASKYLFIIPLWKVFLPVPRFLSTLQRVIYYPGHSLILLFERRRERDPQTVLPTPWLNRGIGLLLTRLPRADPITVNIISMG